MAAWTLILVSLALAVGLFLALWLLALIRRDPSFVDAFWAFGMVVMALSSFALGDGDIERRALLTGLAAAWGMRLGLHLLFRWLGEGADKRYQRMMKGAEDKRGWGFAKATLLFVFLPQAVLMWLVSLPVQAPQAVSSGPLGLIALAGTALALFGIAFETIGDAQLARFKRDSANKGKVMDTGLWAWTRHPNYFGDACAWWGIWLVAAETGWVGIATVIGPIFLTYTLTRWSGAPLLEAGLKRSRPGYAEYVKRTSPFIPWPPKRREDPASGVDG